MMYGLLRQADVAQSVVRILGKDEVTSSILVISCFYEASGRNPGAFLYDRCVEKKICRKRHAAMRTKLPMRAAAAASSLLVQQLRRFIIQQRIALKHFVHPVEGS